MAILDDVKAALRISATNTAFNSEINDLISAAIADLKLSGVTSEMAIDTDTLIKRALITYVKAHFGYDNPDAERFLKSYDLLKTHLTLSNDYSYYKITFTVSSGGSFVEDVEITFNDETRETDVNGTTIFEGIKAGVNQEYTVSKTGYTSQIGYLDVTASVTKTITLV